MGSVRASQVGPERIRPLMPAGVWLLAMALEQRRNLRGEEGAEGRGGA